MKGYANKRCQFCGQAYYAHSSVKFCGRTCRVKANSKPVASGCWEWTLGLDKDGYGVVTEGRGVIMPAHRMSYEAFLGKIPSGLLACHKCDNRRCVNPDHLFLGTHADNANDMKTKGRQPIGNRSHKIKLTPAAVRQIRRASKPAHEVAGAHGVSRATITAVRQRRSWKHVD